MNNIIATTTGILSAFPMHEVPSILKEAGYNGIEVWPESFWLQEKQGITSFQKLKKSIKDSGLKGVIHAPLKDLVSAPEEKFNVCSIYEDLRMKSIDGNLKGIRLAKDLGFHLVNMHPGRLDRDNDNPEAYWQILFESFELFVKEAEKSDMILSVEAMGQRPKEFVLHAEDIKRLISHFNSGNLGATLDIVHAFTHGEEFPLKHMEELGVHLRHLHASGFYGIEGKTHCPFSLDKDHNKYFRNIIKEVALNYDSMITIEGQIKSIMPETKENQLKVIRENLEFMLPLVL